MLQKLEASMPIFISSSTLVILLNRLSAERRSYQIQIHSEGDNRKIPPFFLWEKLHFWSSHQWINAIETVALSWSCLLILQKKCSYSCPEWKQNTIWERTQIWSLQNNSQFSKCEAKNNFFVVPRKKENRPLPSKAWVFRAVLETVSESY